MLLVLTYTEGFVFTNLSLDDKTVLNKSLATSIIGDSDVVDGAME